MSKASICKMSESLSGFVRFPRVSCSVHCPDPGCVCLGACVLCHWEPKVVEYAALHGPRSSQAYECALWKAFLSAAIVGEHKLPNQETTQ